MKNDVLSIMKLLAPYSLGGDKSPACVEFYTLFGKDACELALNEVRIKDLGLKLSINRNNGVHAIDLTMTEPEPAQNINPALQVYMALVIEQSKQVLLSSAGAGATA